ncbi:hypothetical protein LguiA_023370 [Lonicera macranthoides]
MAAHGLDPHGLDPVQKQNVAFMMHMRFGCCSISADLYSESEYQLLNMAKDIDGSAE